MFEIVTQTAEVFVPIFVAMSPLTVLPIFLSMTEDMTHAERGSTSRRAVLTAFVVALVIVVSGQAIFRFLSITVDDLRVAGGVILFILALHDLVLAREDRKRAEVGQDAGVVPLGTPLIVGPATMTACVVLADTHGRLPVFLSLTLNLGLIAVMLHYADRMHSFVRPSYVRAFGKVMSLFLAAIAVAMLRTGISAFVRGR